MKTYILKKTTLSHQNYVSFNPKVPYFQVESMALLICKLHTFYSYSTLLIPPVISAKRFFNNSFLTEINSSKLSICKLILFGIN